MHRVLQIPELREYIFHLINKRSAYASLAAVCRAFQDPALDALYGDVDDFCNLLKCMPGNLFSYQIYKPTLNMPMLFLKRNMTSGDWHTLSKYTSRVRSLQITWDLSETDTKPYALLEDTVCYALARCAFPGTMFPKLHTLRLIGPERAGVSMLQPFLLGERLRHLYISPCKVFVDDVYKHIPYLPYLSPLLETLVIDFSSNVETTPGQLSIELLKPTADMASVLCQMNNLQRIGSGPMSEWILAHLASLPKLSTLTLMVFKECGWLSSPSSVISVPKLTSLTLQAAEYETATLALRKLADSARRPDQLSDSPVLELRTVGLEVLWVLATGGSLSVFTSALASCTSPTHLQEIIISNRSPNGAMTIPPLQLLTPITYDDLRPLAAFSKLTRLSLSFVFIPFLPRDASKFFDLLPSWPLLEILEARPLHLDIATLVHILRALTKLSILSVDVIVSDTELEDLSQEETFKALPSNDRIRSMTFGERYEWSSLRRYEPLFQRLMPRARWFWSNIAVVSRTA
ncbi:hypothetical protein CONPUDRAFT_160875 [Coniophora puteana RWD-64-598 SS2]|uniref:F-box domain-containing protein n=1 Tax=Coniophora puteana (strain RWD-64-598) TaxID=741705 RepID=A0A5M3N4I5_CONPW|nr:uncharacterized protein CONPUDRAFT_160875 [Coniophora puteana RWD-64-598 SS2]EIW85964.1 hypothetical protein CONPUDRAFT_160875 [Coniophora puteana RWD-64-598 SS2]